MARLLREIGAGEADRPGRHAQVAHDRAHEARLARAVAADQPDHASLGDLDGEPAQRLDRGDGDLEPADLEHQASAPVTWRRTSASASTVAGTPSASTR